LQKKEKVQNPQDPKRKIPQQKKIKAPS
jgi:hypothetical protein